MSASGLRWLVVASCVLVTPVAVAKPMRGPLFAATDPIAVRGGVLMVPLRAEREGSDWPRSLELGARDDTRIQGIVAWVYAQSADRDPAWTADPRGLAVRAIRPDDDTADGDGGVPYLIAWLPVDGRGPLQLGRQTIEPRWMDPVTLSARAQPQLELGRSTVWPDPHSPFEYWRWVQLAGRLDMMPPATDGFGREGAMVARHYADLWRIGLLRLGRADPEALHRCLNMLLRICYDGPEAFAAWVMDPGEIGGLLQVLHDRDRTDAQVAVATDQWVERQGLLVMRIAPPRPDLVALSVANRSRVGLKARFQWLGSGEVAAAVTLPPGVLRHVNMPRPPAAARPGGVDFARSPRDVQVLLVEAGGRLQRTAFPTGPLPARPPGIGFVLRPPLTLFEVQTGWSRVQQGLRPTFLQLRRRHGRWEVFLECRRPGRLGRATDLRGLRDHWETRGSEAITLVFGGEPATAVLTVPENGDHRLFRGSGGGTLEVHRQSYADRWYCRVVVPDHWLGGADGPALLGAIRTHGGDQAIETGPYASLPWRPAPGCALIDLRAW
ncbi:MAG: hypothetical protein E2O40_06015 [Planctomycetota bacterium]|nr:MAG: hypothetical protein E2O40_06015 [Planctomycetota bacterium]